jgi:hypothetical protein
VGIRHTLGANWIAGDRAMVTETNARRVLGKLSVNVHIMESWQSQW